MIEGVSIEEIEGRRSQSRMIPMSPRLHDPPSTAQCGDSPIGPLSPIIEKLAPEPMEPAERPTGSAERSPTTTRSKREVKKP